MYVLMYYIYSYSGCTFLAKTLCQKLRFLKCVNAVFLNMIFTFRLMSENYSCIILSKNVRAGN
jgi:hypothetical protein